ncbi:MAG: cytochrome c [Verrucomicrobiaceae bacterium]|nr:cytochrome c [Verrucomicrobiaceae bacterium]
MSAETSDSKNPILSVIGNVFLFLVPLSLIVMLGIVGAAFLGGIKQEKVEAEPTAAATQTTPAAPPAAAPAAPAPAAGGETATAPAPAGGGSTAAIDPEVMALGKASYAMCAACHGPDGTGLKVGPSLMAPSLIGSEVLLGDPDYSLLVVLKGIAKENMDFMGVMAPLAAGLDDEKLAAVLTYTRNEWGNSAAPVTVEEAASARARFAAVEAPAGVKRSEIEEIAKAHK